MALGQSQGTDMYLEKLEKPAKRLFSVVVVVSQGNSGNIRE